MPDFYIEVALLMSPAYATGTLSQSGAFSQHGIILWNEERTALDITLPVSALSILSLCTARAETVSPLRSQKIKQIAKEWLLPV